MIREARRECTVTALELQSICISRGPLRSYSLASLPICFAKRIINGQLMHCCSFVPALTFRNFIFLANFSSYQPTTPRQIPSNRVGDLHFRFVGDLQFDALTDYLA